MIKYSFSNDINDWYNLRHICNFQTIYHEKRPIHINVFLYENTLDTIVSAANWSIVGPAADSNWNWIILLFFYYTFAYTFFFHL